MHRAASLQLLQSQYMKYLFFAGVFAFSAILYIR